MSLRLFSKKIFFAILATMFFVAFPAFAETDVRLFVGGCNNDLMCQPQNGEDYNNCSTDCAPPPQPTTTPTTTPPAPSSPRPPSSSSISYYDIVVTATYDSAFISWRTQRPTQGVVSWGTNTDYADGSVGESKFGLDHIAKISNLKSGKEYSFAITMHDGSGNTAIFRGVFKTQSIAEAALPPNVMYLSTFETDAGIGLKWQNPEFADFAYIRVLRTTDDYPLDPFEGRVVYEGGAQSFIDINVKDNVQYFYSVFVRNKAGVYSSGSLISEIKRSSTPPNPLDTENGVPIPSTPANTGSIPSTSSSSTVLHRISFIQDDEDISYAGNTIPIDGSKSLYISIPKSLVPDKNEVFIAIDLQEENIPILLYLLRYNEATKNIEGEIPAFKKSGSYNFTIQTLDGGRFTQITSGNFIISYTSAEEVQDKSAMKYVLIALEFVFTYWYVFLLLLIILILVIKKLVTKKEEEPPLY